MRAGELVEQVEREGYFLLPDFFSRAEVEAAKRELVPMFERDRAERAERGIKGPNRTDDTGLHWSLTREIHQVRFPSTRSRAFAALLCKALEHADIRAFMERVVGPEYRLRLDVSRISTGIDDTVDEFQIPHNWHRDTPGEFTFGIFFDDMTAPFSGGTAVIKGTHWFRYNPIWDLMLGKRDRTTQALLHTHTYLWPAGAYPRVFNNRLKERLRPNVQEIRGRPGDLYFFLNDTWHGRFPNKTGRPLMTARFGGFPTDFPFKDDRALPEGENIQPPVLRQLYSARERPVSDRSVLVHRLVDQRRTFPLLQLAHVEKRIALAGTLAAARMGAKRLEPLFTRRASHQPAG